MLDDLMRQDLRNQDLVDELKSLSRPDEGVWMTSCPYCHDQITGMESFEYLFCRQC